MPTWKHIVVVGGALTAGAAVIGGFVYLANKRGALRRVTSYFVAADEGFAETPVLYEPKEKKILVLGLEGAGKTALLAHLAAASVDEGQPGSTRRDSISGPTEGFRVMNITKNGRSYSIWEIGGKPEFRKYWGQFFQDTDLLVFVIESTNKPKHTEAYDALRNALSDPRLSEIPVLIVASKQDISGAIDPEEILEESGLNEHGGKKGGKRRILKIVGTNKTDNLSREAAYSTMFQMCDY